MKTGRLSKEERQAIEDLAETASVQEIATQLDRSVEAVENYLDKIGKSANRQRAMAVQAEYDIKSRPYWKEMQAQFTEEELELFLHMWKEIVAQFRKDVLATEELQIIDLIKLDILMNRALREQQDSLRHIRILEEEIILERRREPDQQDREQIFNMERQIASFRAAKEGLSREFKDLQTKKAALYKDLKATREQRVKKLESNKQTLASLVMQITQDPEFFENEGKELEKMRMAMEGEKRRLAAYHTYEDNSVDRPLLNSETVFYEGE